MGWGIDIMANWLQARNGTRWNFYSYVIVLLFLNGKEEVELKQMSGKWMRMLLKDKSNWMEFPHLRSSTKQRNNAYCLVYKEFLGTKGNSLNIFLFLFEYNSDFD